MERQYKTAETEQVSHMEQDEKKTFIITGISFLDDMVILYNMRLRKQVLHREGKKT